MLILAVILFFVNLVVFPIFYLRLKSRFSSRRVLSEIRQEMDSLIVDLGRETDRDVALLESRIQGLRNLMEEAQQMILLSSRETEKRKRSSEIEHQLTMNPHKEETKPVEPVRVYTRQSVIRSSSPVTIEVPLAERVLDLARKDISPQMIAKTLSVSLGEVELILDMNNSSL